MVRLRFVLPIVFVGTYAVRAEDIPDKPAPKTDDEDHNREAFQAFPTCIAALALLRRFSAGSSVSSDSIFPKVFAR